MNGIFYAFKFCFKYYKLLTHLWYKILIAIVFVIFNWCQASLIVLHLKAKSVTVFLKYCIFTLLSLLRWNLSLWTANHRILIRILLSWKIYYNSWATISRWWRQIFLQILQLFFYLILYFFHKLKLLFWLISFRLLALDLHFL